jgi:anti-anti-sigma regulatory factor
MRMLAAAAVTLINRGGDLVLVHPQPSVARTLALLRLEDMFTIRSGRPARPDTCSNDA